MRAQHATCRPHHAHSPSLPSDAYSPSTPLTGTMRAQHATCRPHRAHSPASSPTLTRHPRRSPARCVHSTPRADHPTLTRLRSIPRPHPTPTPNPAHLLPRPLRPHRLTLVKKASAASLASADLHPHATSAPSYSHAYSPASPRPAVGRQCIMPAKVCSGKLHAPAPHTLVCYSR
jgi:hypothetical protein